MPNAADTPTDRADVLSLAGTKRQSPLPSEDGVWRVDRVLAELAGAQHGVVGAFQLVAAGIGRRVISSRLERGALHRVHRGVYAVGHPEVTVMGRWMAATLALGPGSVLSHRTAGELWGIVPRSRRAVDVTRQTEARRQRGIAPHRSSVPADERTVIDGIPVTTAPRTMLDYAAGASRPLVERALNEMEVLGLTDALSIPDLLERHPRRRGSVVLRALLDEAAETRGVTKHELEARFAALIDRHCLPRPRRNADLAVGDRFFSVDCLWSEARLVVELDGHSVHGTRRAFERDRERDWLLLARGWRVMRVTWRQLQGDAESIVADLRAALRFGHE